jgi:SOUL heme-binding protein
LKPLAPTFVTVNGDLKTMTWALVYENPNEPDSMDCIKINDKIIANCEKNEVDVKSYRIITVPEKVVVVGRFTDAIVESVVRKATQQLLELCRLDGLKVVESPQMMFAQYNAVYSMGKRRSEVHIELQPNSHPW